MASFPPPSSLSAPSAQPQPQPQPAPLRLHVHLPSQPPPRLSLPLTIPRALRLRIQRRIVHTPPHAHSAASYSSGVGEREDGGHGGADSEEGGHGGDGGGDSGGGEGDGEPAPDHHGPGGEALIVLAQLGRKLESLPSDLAAAVEAGRVSADVVRRFHELEASAFVRWLLQFRGFRERLLADDLFLTKLGIECGIGLLAKSAAEFQKRGENFAKEIDFVISDVVMAIVADIMLVYLPAPTVSLQPPLARNAGAIASFFHNCPDNAFQIALAGRSFTLVQRLASILLAASLQRNAIKLFAVGTTASMIGTSVTNTLIKARKAVDKDLDDEVEDIPVLATSAAYGVYMSISSNLRYQFLAGVIEQRMLEPLLHNHKLLLSALCFAVRSGNTFLGSLLWVDYARWIGVQKAPEEA
ncbi:hypothetical protein U9M48_016450 [Paspalum notatum var. saurae]|uniref:Uncharacterized protein n=1 Tax=Paspalum notatum var. saurae TaxID=547442 RepID=A0AAQ3WMV0_PASNO